MKAVRTLKRRIPISIIKIGVLIDSSIVLRLVKKIVQKVDRRKVGLCLVVEIFLEALGALFHLLRCTFKPLSPSDLP